MAFAMPQTHEDLGHFLQIEVFRRHQLKNAASIRKRAPGSAAEWCTCFVSSTWALLIAIELGSGRFRSGCHCAHTAQAKRRVRCKAARPKPEKSADRKRCSAALVLHALEVDPFGAAALPTTLPARRRARHNARLVGTIWFLASFAVAVATIWIALTHFV